MPDAKCEADDYIRELNLLPHPEGGHYRETFRDDSNGQDRAASTAIYYLLKAGERSHWHRVDAAEVWHWYAGAPLELCIAGPSNTVTKHRLGSDIASGERPQIIVPKYHWQSASSLGRFTLVGCTVAPAFQFSGFEMAKPGWSPG